MACKYTYNGQTYTKDEFYSLVATTMVQPKTVPKYNKILFPTGNTASKVEGHITLEEFKKQKEDRIKELENNPSWISNGEYVIENSYFKHEGETFDQGSKLIVKDGFYNIVDYDKSKILSKEQALNFLKEADITPTFVSDKKEINQLKQELERLETEGFGVLKPIYNFYENQVANILKKQGYNPEKITDEYGNGWYEVPILANTVTKPIYLQLDDKVLGDAITGLDTYLLSFMKQFGVKSKEFDNLKERLGVNALGATDVLNKLIWYNKNRNEETIPEEVGHMITMLMGENHPDINELLKNITNWSEYQDIKDQYLPIYKNEKQVKIEAIGKLIAKSLVKNYKISGLDQTLLDKAIKSIREFIEKILDSLNLANVMQYNDRVADHIALNILMGNKDYIAKISNTNPKLDYEKALNANPFAERIIKTFTNLNNFKLTGSIALAGQGETIHRPSEEPIHDIDFEVNSSKAYENIEDILGEMNALPYHFGWDNQQKDYVTYAYLIPEKGYKIKINKRDFERGNGWVTDYNVVDSEGNIVEKSSTNHLAIDFFVYKNGVSQNNNSIFKNSQDIYKGKMTISRDGNNERLFQRAKDQEDYILSRPKNLSNSIPAFVYYQLENELKPGVDFVFKQTPELKEVGSPEQYSQYLDTIFPDSKVKDIVYHGTGNFKGDKFTKNGYFTTLNTAEEYAKFNEDMLIEYAFVEGIPENEIKVNKKVIPAIINIKNPKYLDKQNFREVEKNYPNNDGVISTNTVDPLGGTELQIKASSEQIHILGSKQDIEGFKSFVGEQSSEPTINPSDALINKYLQAKMNNPLAPNGNPSILFKSILDLPEVNGNKFLAYQLYAKTKSQAFRQWFDDSVLVDSNGEPQIFYHYTNNQFNIFDLDKAGTGTGEDSEGINLGFFFSTEKEIYKGLGKNLVSVYLKSQKPIEGEAANKAIEDNNVETREFHDSVLSDTGTVIVFDPEQVKSVFNRGSFLTSDNSLTLDIKRDGYTPDEEGGEIWKIDVIEKDENIGQVLLENDGMNLTAFETDITKGSEVNSGTNTYLKIAEEAQKAGLTFRSDRISDRMSEAAKRLWDRFVKSDQAEIQGDRYVFTGEPEKVYKNIFNSLPGESQSSTAGQITKNKVIRFLSQIGFTNIQTVSSLVHNGKKIDGDAYVDFMTGVMQIVDGKEDVTLPEEAMHILVKLIAQSSPVLYKTLESEVINYKLYQTLVADESYINNKNYQNEDGSMNYTKLKEEAIGKLLAEFLINSSEGTLGSRERIQKVNSLWRSIVDWIRNIFGKYKNPFKEIIDQIEDQDISAYYGQYSDIAPIDELFLSATRKSVDERDKEYEETRELYETLRNSARDNNIEKIDDQYFQNKTEWKGSRVSDLTEKFYTDLFRNRPLDPLLESYRDQMAEDGKFLHSLFESALYAHIDFETGLLKDKPDTRDDKLTKDAAERAINKKLFDYVKGFLSLYPEGTRFLSETIILDKKQNVLGTVDFIAINPDGKVDIFDWKTTILKNPEGIADYKKEAFNIQINEYKRILKEQYNINNFGKLRAVTINRSYDKKSGEVDKKLVGIDIGDPDASKILDTRLRPTISSEESTGDEFKDKIIAGLGGIYQKFVDQLKAGKKDNRTILSDIAAAIYELRVSNSIKHLVSYMVDLDGKIEILSNQIKKSKDLTVEALDSYLADISMYQDIFESLTTSGKNISILIDDQSIEKKDREHLSGILSRLGRKVDELKEERKNLVAEQASKNSIFNLLSPEKVVRGFNFLFRSMGKHSVATIQYLYELTKKAYNNIEIETDNELKKLTDLKYKFDNYIKSSNLSKKDAVSKLVDFKKGTLHSKISADFYKTRQEVFDSKNAKKITNFIKENYNYSEYIKWFNEKLKENLELWNNLPFSTDPEENKKLRNFKITEFRKLYDINKYPVTAFNSLNKLLWSKNIKEELWESEQYKVIKSNPELKEIYEFFVKKNKELFEIGAIDEWKIYTFFPNIRKTTADIFSFQDKDWASKIKDWGFNGLSNFKKGLVTEDYENHFESKRDPVTGQLLEERFIPFVSGIKADDKSFDLFTVYGLMTKEIAKEKYLQKNDEIARALLHIERAKDNFDTNKYGNVITKAGVPIIAGKGGNAKLFEKYFKGVVLGQSVQNAEDLQITLNLRKLWNKTPLGKLYKFDTTSDLYKPNTLSATKLIMMLNNFHQRRILGLNISSAASNLFGGTFSSNKLYKKYLSNKDLNMAWGQMTSVAFYQSEDMKKRAALVDYFLPLLNNRERFKSEQLSVNDGSKILSQEWLMAAQRKTDEIVDLNIFLALIENTGLINGELVNLREMAMEETNYLNRYQKKDSKGNYSTTEIASKVERDSVEDAFEAKLKELKEKHGLVKQATFKTVERNGKKETIVEIPGVDRFSPTVEKIRDITKTMAKDALGAVDEYDVATYRYSIGWRLFMTFKNWIPRAADVRFAEFHYSQSHHAYEYGRFRMLFRSLANNYLISLSKMLPIVGNVINRTEIGKDQLIKSALALYEEKKKIAKELKQFNEDTFPTEGEFIDMYIQGVNSSFAEFRTAFLMMSVLILGFAAPDDDDTGEEKAWKKLVRRQIDKMQDEVSFFYSPKSMIDIANQSAPIIGLVRDSYNLINNVGKEMVGLGWKELANEEQGQEIMDKAKPMKYTFKVLPVFKEILTYIPTFDSEMGQEWGISLQDKRGF